MHPRGIPALLALLSLSPFAAAERRPLEALLEAARAERAAQMESARPQVHALLDAAVDALEKKRTPQAERDALAAVGVAGGLVLVEELDRDRSTDSAPLRLRAEEARLALSRGWSEPLTPGLLHVAMHGGPSARVRALRLLGIAPDAEAVQPTLEAAFGETEVVIRRAALRSLAQLGGEPADRALRAALAASENQLVAAALEALAQRPRPELAGAVSAIASDPERAGRHWRNLIAWYRAAPAHLDSTEIIRMIAAAERQELPRLQAAELLIALSTFRVTPSREVMERLARVATFPPPEVGEAASICLARWGDRNARRALIKRYDDLVDRHKDDPAVLAQRGRLYLRLGDGAPASRDLKRALDIADSTNHDLPRRDAWVDLARAYMLENRPSQAGDALARANLDPATREKLAADPAFAPLVGHVRNGRALREG